MKTKYVIIVLLVYTAHIFSNVLPFEIALSQFTLPNFNQGNPTILSEHKSVVDSFGNKTFNLAVLNILAKTINEQVLKGSSVNQCEVPRFMAIGSKEIADFLSSKFKLNDIWSEFVQAQGNNKELASAAARVLDTIRTNIADAFSAEIPVAMQNQIDPFLKKGGSYFMVRSTGYEDRTDIANAGGNESVAAVPANVQAIWDAMSIVVQSYFSEKSMKQRLLAGDTITQNYFIPVLIQLMIGEQLWTGSSPSLDAIPISGVMFSRESAGDTPQVVHIQTAFGHNQGVVNSLVAVDSFYIGESGLIHPVIRKKMSRYVAVKKGEKVILDRISNPTELQNRPTLGSALVHDLDKIARRIGQLYKHPMDIEFVIIKKAARYIIYLVQARPLISRTYTQKPNYVTDEYIATLTDTDMARGESIGTAGGFVRDINQVDAVLIKNDLPQALNAYHDDSDRARIQAVIVSKMAPATSHEATQFKGYALPVLVLSESNKQKINQLLSKGNVFIDTQRALVIKGTPDKQKAVEQGWYTHPIPMVTSISSLAYMLGKSSALKNNYDTFIKQLQWASGDTDDLSKTMRELVTIVKQSQQNKPAVIDALKRIVHRVAALIEKKKLEKQIDPMLLEEAQRVLSNALMCAAEVLFSLNALSGSTSTESARMAYLYPIKFLEAVLFQQDNHEVVSCFSYVLLLKKLKEDVQAVGVLAESEQQVGKKPFAYLVQLVKMQTMILAQNNKPLWLRFIKDLASSAKSESGQTLELIKQFSTMVAQLNELNVLDLWINSSFLQAARKDTNPISICKTLIGEVEGDDNNKQLMAWMADKKPILDSWNSKIEAWGDPNAFNALYAQFEQEVVSTFITGNDAQAKEAFVRLQRDAYDKAQLESFAVTYAPLVSRFSRVNNLGKLLMIPFIKQVIDLYDRTIKGMTGSPMYSDKEVLVTRFAKLLMPYVGLMEQLMVLVFSHEKALFTSLHTPWNFAKYITLLRDVLRKAPSELGSYQVSPGFSVGASQIGSQIDYNRARPPTLEDMFTLAHQNMLVTLARLNSDFGIKESDLPQLIQNFYTELQKIRPFKDSTPANLVGVEYQYPNLIAYFNLPLRQHSATFEMSYNANKPNQAILACNFYGHNEGNRMVGLKYYAYLAAHAMQVEFAQRPVSTATKPTGKDASELTQFSWVITDRTPLDEVQKFLALMADMTMNFIDLPTTYFNSVHRIKPFLKEASVSTLKKIGVDLWGLERIDQAELRSLAQDLFASMDKSLFKQEVLLNTWLIDVCIRAELYERAIELIANTLDYIVQNNAFDFPSPKSMGAFQWQDGIRYLNALIEGEKVPSSIKQQAQQLVEKFLSEEVIKKMIAMDEQERGNNQLIALISSLNTAVKNKRDRHMFEIITMVVNLNRFKMHSKQRSDYYKKPIEQLEAAYKDLLQALSATDASLQEKVKAQEQRAIEQEKNKFTQKNFEKLLLEDKSPMSKRFRNITVAINELLQIAENYPDKKMLLEMDNLLKVFNRLASSQLFTQLIKDRNKWLDNIGEDLIDEEQYRNRIISKITEAREKLQAALGESEPAQAGAQEQAERDRTQKEQQEREQQEKKEIATQQAERARLEQERKRQEEKRQRAEQQARQEQERIRAAQAQEAARQEAERIARERSTQAQPAISSSEIQKQFDALDDLLADW